MRTTLDIADDVLFAAKEIARRDKKSLGETISELARRSFRRGDTGPGQGMQVREPVPFYAHPLSQELADYGIVPIPSRGDGTIVTNELIDRIRDEEGI